MQGTVSALLAKMINPNLTISSSFGVPVSTSPKQAMTPHRDLSLDPSRVNESVSGEPLEVQRPPMESQNQPLTPSQNVTPEQDRSPPLVEQETREPSVPLGK